MINGVQIENSAQFKRLAAELPRGKSVPMLVQRRDGPTFLALKLPEKK
jgi:serine protease Do